MNQTVLRQQQPYALKLSRSSCSHIPPPAPNPSRRMPVAGRGLTQPQPQRKRLRKQQEQKQGAGNGSRDMERGRQQGGGTTDQAAGRKPTAGKGSRGDRCVALLTPCWIDGCQAGAVPRNERKLVRQARNPPDVPQSQMGGLQWHHRRLCLCQHGNGRIGKEFHPA